MKLALIQTSLFWEDKAQNLRHFDQKLSQIQPETVDLVVLPEMFTTGFSMAAARLAEPMDGPTLRFLKNQARRLGAAVAGSFICSENEAFFNRLLFVKPDGSFEKYDKRHLFSFAGEDRVFQKGLQKTIVEWRGWRICPLICYDLRFPVWSRNRLSEPYDLLLFVANWPDRRVEHWRSLLAARAIENLAFAAGLNVVGADGEGMSYSGGSTVIDFMGRRLWEANEIEATGIVELDRTGLHAWRAQFGALGDADGFAVN